MKFLYVATDGNLYKIGVSWRPEWRIKQHGKNVRLLQKWHRPYAIELEQSIKGILAYCRARGSEWFSITEKEMMFQVRRAVRIYDDEQAILEGRQPSKR